MRKIKATQERSVVCVPAVLICRNNAYRPTYKAVNVERFSYSVIAMPTDLKVEFIE